MWNGPRAWGAGALPSAFGILATVVSVLCSALLGFYVFSFSYGLPDASLTVASGEPFPAAAVLDDHEGNAVDLGAIAKRDILLVFYRGHW